MGRKILIVCAFLSFIGRISAFGQTTLYSTNFGTSGSLPTGWTATGTNPPALSSSTTSSGYTGASGNYNVMFADNATGYKYLTYSNSFSTVGYTDITVLWGGRRNSSSSPTIDLYWSTDGSTWNGPVTYTQPPSTGTWALVNSSTRVALPAGAEGVSNLRLRWQSNVLTSSNTVSYRMDDVTVEGTVGTVANDNCSGAIALTVNSTCNYTSGTSAGASQSLAGCSGTADDDVWFSFVALASTATITVNPSTTYDAAFELRSGACNGTQVAGSCTDAGGDNVNETYQASGLTVGNTYYIRLWDYGVGSGSSTFDICVYSPVTPCTSPTSINGCGSGYSQTFAASGSSSWAPDICGYTIAGQEKVYSFVAPTTGTYNIYVSGISSSGGSTYMDYGWRSGSCAQTGWTCINYIGSTGTHGSMSWTAGNTYYLLLAAESSSGSLSNTFYMKCPAASGSNIALANNGSQVPTANVAKGTTNQVLHQISLAVTGANTTLTGMQCITAGTYASADITNLKVRYSTNSTLDASDATLSTYTTPGVAGTKTFPSFTSQAITAGTTGYIFITADIAAGATTNNTIRISAVTTSHLTFSTGTKTGSTTNGGYQTIVASATAGIVLADNGTVAAANVMQGTSNHILIKTSLAVTTTDAILTGMQATTAGTYLSADVTHLKVWYSADNTLDEFDEVLSTYATPGAAGTKTFPSFVSKTILVGTTGYIFITGYIAPAATATRTIRVNALATTDFTFLSGSKSGSSSNGGYQTVIALTNSNDDISGAVALSNTNYLPQAAGTWATYSNSGATAVDEPSAPPSWTTAPANTVWFKFTATTTAQSVSTNYNAAASAISDTRLAVYSSSNNTFSGELALIGENENILYNPGGGLPKGADFNLVYWNAGSPTYWHAAVTVTGLTVGNTYFVMADGSTTGNFRIATNTAPANDACETATDLEVNTVYNVDNTSATIWSNLNQPDAAFDISGNTSQENLIFFKFRPNTTETYYINQSASTCDGTSATGTQFLVFEANVNCDNIPTILTGYNTALQLYSSGTTTSARAIPVDMTAGSTYYLATDGGRGDECTFTLVVTRTWPLPIDLQNFTAKCNDDPTEVDLSWKTAVEINNDFFTVERSIDGKTYSAIGNLPGAGSSSVTKHYSFVDRDPLAGTSYYRIAQTDYNGQSETFAPLAVHCSDETGFSMHLNGTLVDDDNIYVTVEGASDKKVLVVMTDVYGREVFSTMLIENADSYLYNLKPSSELTTGLYYITASSNNKYTSKKIVIK